MKRIAITLAALALAAAYSMSLDAQTIRDPQSPASLRDSLVLVDAQGSRTVSYPRTQISTEVSKIKKSGVHQKDRILNDQQLGQGIENGKYEVAGTVYSEDGRLHWVNITGTRSYRYLRWFGGNTTSSSKFRVWNPADGTSYYLKSDAISNLRIF